MKVLFLSNDDGGLVTFRRELLETLVEKGIEVYCCTPAGDFVRIIESIGCRFIPIEMDTHGTNPFKELGIIKYYKKILKEIMPDIVFTYTIKCNSYGGMACAGLDIPYVANVTGLGTSVENGGLMQKISLTLYKMGLRKARKVFFQNSENRDFMLNRKIIKCPYDLLPGSGVNLNRYTVTEYPCGENVDFVFVARIRKEKGIDQYIDAAKEIRKRHPEARFHICGACDQEYKKVLEELNENGTVIYHGLVSDMREIYKFASCTILPTYYPEGLSNVLLESAASGRPIITTGRSGCREVVDDGINGFIVRQKDSMDLIEKIEKFLALTVEQRKNMGLAGRAKVEKEFDRRIVINKYLEEIGLEA